MNLAPCVSKTLYIILTNHSYAYPMVSICFLLWVDLHYMSDIGCILSFIVARGSLGPEAQECIQPTNQQQEHRLIQHCILQAFSCVCSKYWSICEAWTVTIPPPSPPAPYAVKVFAKHPPNIWVLHMFPAYVQLHCWGCAWILFHRVQWLLSNIMRNGSAKCKLNVIFIQSCLTWQNYNPCPCESIPKGIS